VYDFAADHSLRYFQSFIRKTPRLLNKISIGSSQKSKVIAYDKF